MVLREITLAVGGRAERRRPGRRCNEITRLMGIRQGRGGFWAIVGARTKGIDALYVPLYFHDYLRKYD